jgi:hypothetical protein
MEVRTGRASAGMREGWVGMVFSAPMGSAAKDGRFTLRDQDDRKGTTHRG